MGAAHDNGGALPDARRCCGGWPWSRPWPPWPRWCCPSSPARKEDRRPPTELKKVKATLADAKADAKKLTAALNRANEALSLAENELAQADQQRRDAHARGVRATAALEDAAERVERLRRIMGDRARGVYIAGDPTGLNALVQSGSTDQLLGQVAILDHLAKESNNSLADLVVAQQDYALARSALAEAEADARRGRGPDRPQDRPGQGAARPPRSGQGRPGRQDPPAGGRGRGAAGDPPAAPAAPGRPGPRRRQVRPVGDLGRRVLHHHEGRAATRPPTTPAPPPSASASS